MEQQYITSLLDAYKRGYARVYESTDNPPEMKLHWSTLLHRNYNREYPVPQSAIEKMLGKLVPPAPFEAETVEWIAT